MERRRGVGFPTWDMSLGPSLRYNTEKEWSRSKRNEVAFRVASVQEGFTV